MTPPLFYIASPYSHSDPKIVTERYEKVKRLAAYLCSKQFFIFSPVLHWHDTALSHALPGHWEFWKDYNLHMLDLCQSMLLFRIDGWEASVGVAAEIQHCRATNKSIFRIDDKDIRP